jgi:transposase
MGEFIGRAYRRAYIDYRRITKAGHTPGPLKAELIDSADLQHPKHAIGFDYWVLLKGTKDKLYIPARSHRALNRTLALPGAKLNTGTKGSAFVMRKNGKWYVYVTVSVPLAEVQAPNGWLGCDIGARSAVVRSDGYKGPDLRPLFRRDNERKRNHAYLGLERKRSMSPARQAIAREARRTVLVALKSGRGIALEAPKNLIRWKKHAARFFGYRVMLLAAIYGLAVQEINPAYTSITCSQCGLVNRHLRHKETFHCWRCGLTVNADFNAAVNLCHRAYAITGVSHGSLSLSPGGDADG